MQIRLTEDLWDELFDQVIAFQQNVARPDCESIKALQDGMYFNDPIARAVKSHMDCSWLEVLTSPAANLVLVRDPGKEGKSFRLTVTGRAVVMAFDDIIEKVVSNHMKGIESSFVLESLTLLKPAYSAEVLVAHNE